MANIRSGNCFYVDTAHSVASDAAEGNIQVNGILVTPTAAGAILVLHDATSDLPKMEIRLNTQDSQFYDLSSSIITFQGGIKVATLTNAKATIISREK